MQHSESLTNIAAALVKAQKAIQAVHRDKIGKIQTKTGGSYEYKYTDLATVIDAVKGPLNDNGIVFIQSPGGDSTGATVTTTLLHESGEYIRDTLYLPVSQGTAQAYGSAITYGKRYGLQSMVGLPSEDDDAKKASEDDDKRKPIAEQMTETEQAITKWETTLKGCLDGDGLAKVWANMPKEVRALKRLQNVKDECKAGFNIGMPA